MTRQQYRAELDWMSVMITCHDPYVRVEVDYLPTPIFESYPCTYRTLDRHCRERLDGMLRRAQDTTARLAPGASEREIRKAYNSTYSGQ